MVDVSVAAGRDRSSSASCYKYGAANVPRAIARSFDGATFGAARSPTAYPRATCRGGVPRVDVNAAGPEALLGCGAPGTRPAGRERRHRSTLAGRTWATGFRVDSINNADNVPHGRGGGRRRRGTVGLAWEASAAAWEVRVRQRSGAGALTGRDDRSNGFGSANGTTRAAADTAGHVAVGFDQGAAATMRIVAAIVDPIPAPQPPTPTPASAAARRGHQAADRDLARHGLGVPAWIVAAEDDGPAQTAHRHDDPLRVDEQSRTTLTFRRLLHGRRVGRRCLPTPGRGAPSPVHAPGAQGQAHLQHGPSACGAFASRAASAAGAGSLPAGTSSPCRRSRRRRQPLGRQAQALPAPRRAAAPPGSHGVTSGAADA